MKPVPKITTHPFEGMFLDLDGVFADFDRGFFDYAGRWPHEVPTNRLWALIHKKGDFFLKLPLCEHAEQLWEYTKQFNPIFLTGAPSSNTAREHKREWVARTFGEEWRARTIVLPKKEKQLHSGPNKVLIDDTVVNLDQWASKGGHAVHHKGNVWDTIDKVEELRLAYAV